MCGVKSRWTSRVGVYAVGIVHGAALGQIQVAGPRQIHWESTEKGKETTSRPTLVGFCHEAKWQASHPEPGVAMQRKTHSDVPR